MKNYGMPQIHDLTSDGSTSVALTPGAAIVSAEFTVNAPKSFVGDNWPLAQALVTRVRVGLDQAASGGAAINWDDLPRIVDSFNTSCPLFGTMWPRDSATGPIVKHIMEFFGAGYQYTDGARNQIAAADGDTAVDLYFVQPFAQEFLFKPHHASPWMGWLNAGKHTVYLAASTVLDSLSTGLVLEATTNVQCWIEYVVSPKLHIPHFPQWHVYEAPAAGGTTALLQGVGTANGLQDVKDGSRLAALLELSDQKGMGAADGADNITSVTIPQLGQDVTVNVDAFFAAFRRIVGGHKGPVSGVATTIVHDRAGNPEGMSATPNGVMNTATAMYTPYRAPGRDAQISKMPKFFGELKIVRTFTSNPATGRHRFACLEFREFSQAKKAEMLARTGKPVKGVSRIYSSKVPERPGEIAVLPEQVAFADGS